MLRKGEIRSLTGLRGIAACFVVIYHFYSGVADKGRVGIFINHGYMAVDIFFMLSGFVMALTYQRDFFDAISIRNHSAFLYKRLSRIFPLYVFALLTVLVFPYVGINTGSGFTLWQVTTNALMIQCWGLSGSIVVPSWSISTEFFAYLVFPILMAWTLRVGGARSITMGFACVVLLTFVAARSNSTVGVAGRKGPLDISVGTTMYPLLRCLSEFALGLLAYRATQVAKIMRVAEWRRTADLLALAIVALLAVRGADLVIALLFLPLIVSLAVEKSSTARLLGHPVIYWLGMISYSIYLMHTVVEMAVDAPIRHVLMAMHVPHAYSYGHLPIAGLVVIVSALTFYGIEKPARNWFRTVAGLSRGAIEMNAGLDKAAQV